jgi:hypothetical protein
MQANPTNDRLKFILKTYGQKYPVLVMDMINIVAHTVGVDDWAAAIDTPAGRDADPVYFRDLEQWFANGNRVLRTVDGHATTELATTTVALVSELPQFQTRHQADPLFPWMATQLAKLLKIDDKYDSYYSWRRSLTHRGNLLAQWYDAERPDLGKYNLFDAYEQAERWQKQKDIETPPTQGEVVTKLANGWTAQKLTTRKQLEEEGERMVHCVGGYHRAVADGSSIIYSLRDPEGHPHVTIEVKPPNSGGGWRTTMGRGRDGRPYVEQTMGYEDENPPADEFMPYVEEFWQWLESEGVRTPYVPPALRPYVKAIDDVGNIDIRDEDGSQIVELAKEWLEAVGSPEEARAWMEMGIEGYRADSAGELKSEGVTPKELSTWPWAVQSAVVTRDHEISDLVPIGRMAAKLYFLAEQRYPTRVSSQTELFEPAVGAAARVPGHDPIGKKRYSQSIEFVGGWHDDYEGSDPRFAWIYPAEEWLAAGFKADDEAPHRDGAPLPVKSWFLNRFTPEQANAWRNALIEEGDVAAELRDRRVTPKMVEELEEAGQRLEGRERDGTWRETEDHVWGLTAKQIVDEIDAAGMRRNPKRTSKKRTSKRRVSRPRR